MSNFAGKFLTKARLLTALQDISSDAEIVFKMHGVGDVSIVGVEQVNSKFVRLHPSPEGSRVQIVDTPVTYVSKSNKHVQVFQRSVDGKVVGLFVLDADGNAVPYHDIS